MKRYTVAEVRERLADVLNEAEQGTPVCIERRGVRYVLRRDTAPAPKRRKAPLIDVLDPAVDDGQWSWTWKPGGLQFRRRRTRS